MWPVESARSYVTLASWIKSFFFSTQHISSFSKSCSLNIRNLRRILWIAPLPLPIGLVLLLRLWFTLKLSTLTLSCSSFLLLKSMLPGEPYLTSHDRVARAVYIHSFWTKLQNAPLDPWMHRINPLFRQPLFRHCLGGSGYWLGLVSVGISGVGIG